MWEGKAHILWNTMYPWVWVVGCGLVVSMDDRGRILIPKDIRRKVRTKLFTLELMDDGTIVLKPVACEVLGLASRFKGLLKYGSLEELEEKQEEFVRKERRV
ncbi:MAG: hypothetical protein B6U76_03460 [Desulfurococcales archaeon ex4484_217_2]|nr:MAG: hypothetical protein B6U76_03460 [Desulfurococcales archaeon ex4484_217_2]